MHDALLEEFKGALIDLTTAMKAPHTGDLVRSMECLDALVAQRGARMDPRLRHFLERRSYAKALAFVSGEISAAPPGGCSSGSSGMS